MGGALKGRNINTPTTMAQSLVQNYFHLIFSTFKVSLGYAASK
jgi:hypothetical protein